MMLLKQQNRILATSLLLFVVVGWLGRKCHGFTYYSIHSHQQLVQQQQQQRQTDGWNRFATTTTSTTTTDESSSTTSSSSSSASPNNEKEEDTIRHDIEEMRREALRRLDALNVKMEELSRETGLTTTTTATTTTTTTTTKPTRQPKDYSPKSSIATESSQRQTTLKDADAPPPSLSTSEIDKTLPKSSLAQDNNSKVTKSNTALSSSSSLLSPPPLIFTKEDYHLLDGTHWRVMLNIGREPGTWMPKTWGASGERLLMNLELEFTQNQCYERDDFLNGVAGAKELKVHTLTTAPTMHEGSQPVAVRATGGWRIGRGQGPAGTDLLRFYIEILDQEVRHSGGDVYCPVGRVYFTCGYFPLTHRDSSATAISWRDLLRREHDAILSQYNKLAQDNETNNGGGGSGGGGLISWDGLKRSKQMLELRMQASKVAKLMEEAQVREPEKAMLRLSRQRNVGLTREGGLCIKVIKGMTVEYHILGKFSLASMEPYQHHHQQPSDLMP